MPSNLDRCKKDLDSLIDKVEELFNAMQAECFPKQFKTEIEKLGGWPIQARFWLEWAYSICG